jgi:beta-phosphoglucomutase
MQRPTTQMIDAIIFDLDGVLTDTAEYHFQAWKRLADEEGIPFTREDNEKLRGVSRRESLALLLNGRSISDDDADAWMTRKNGYYREMIQSVTAKDLLPGVQALLAEIREAGLKIAIASASKNAADVLNGLGIRNLVDVLVDGTSPARPKPAPDLFLQAARELGVPPVRALVIEDAAAGIEAAHAAGMIAVALGPEERFEGRADLTLLNLDGITLSELTYAATWRVSEAQFEPERQHVIESIMTQGNGYLGTRATFEERNRGDQQATMIHGMWDDAPIVFTELANSPDWTALDITVNGTRFAPDTGTISDYARWHDLRDGVLYRRLRWQPQPDGPVLDLYFSRFPSLADPHIMAAHVEVDCVSGEAAISVAGSLNSHVENTGLLHWHPVSQEATEDHASVLLETRHTGKHLAMSMTMEASTTGAAAAENCPGVPGLRIESHLHEGQSLAVDKVVSVFSSRDTDDPLNAARSRLYEASHDGFAALEIANRAAWARFWRDGDVIIDGDDEAQLSLRHALYQLRIAASDRDERVSIAAKTLSGFGYRGHAFWDTEIFILPFFTYTQPSIARNMLMYRWHTFDGARRNAEDQGLAGARFAWESAETGDEVTPTFVPHPKNRHELIRIWCGDIELHITADVAYAIWQYWQTTGDDTFMCEVGAPILLETAIYWADRAEPENGRYSIRDVIGPDEYHEHVDNNAFTNVMVRWHLEHALEMHRWLHGLSSDAAAARALDEHLNITPEALAHWRDIADNIVIIRDPDTGLMEQFEGFFKLKEVDWPSWEGRTKSMQFLLGIEGTNEHQVIKQADVIITLCLLRDQFDQQTWQSNWDYYVPRTDHSYGSSLGPAIHAWAAAEMNQIDVAYEHFQRAARTDLADVRGNAGEGVHGASMGALWQSVVFGFAGLRTDGNTYTITPRLPSHWKRLAFNFYLHGQRHAVDLHAASIVSNPQMQAGETS